MRQYFRLASAIAALLAAACGRQSTMDAQMKQDLEAASASTMELAPSRGARHVVSAIEQAPQAQPTQTKTRSVAAPTKVLVNPQTAQKVSEPVATRPSQRPTVSPPPPGGYKTVDEVLRNAPFPIKP